MALKVKDAPGAAGDAPLVRERVVLLGARTCILPVPENQVSSLLAAFEALEP